MSKTMTKTAIINSTVKHYSSNPRAKTPSGYEYETYDGRKCAVGRCLNKKGLDSVGNSSVEVEFPYEEDLDPALKPIYRGHPVAFWYDLQGLHDNTFYWYEKTSAGNTLSERGKVAKAVLIKKWSKA